MGIATNGYDIVLLLHILCSIAGFGAIFFNGVYATQAKRRGGLPALAIAEANNFVSFKLAEKFIWAVPVFGFALVGMSHQVFKFSQTWIWLSIAIYLVSTAIALWVLKPISKKMQGLLGELSSSNSGCGNSGGCTGNGGDTGTDGCGGPTTGSNSCDEVARRLLRDKADQLDQLGKKMSALGGILHLALVAILYLMIFKPGGPRI